VSPPTESFSTIAASTARDTPRLAAACAPRVIVVVRSASRRVPPVASSAARAFFAARVWIPTSSVTTASLVAKWTKKVPFATCARAAISATVTSW